MHPTLKVPVVVTISGWNMIRSTVVGIVVVVILCQASIAQPNKLIDQYRKGELFKRHKAEAFAVHQALIFGNIGDSTLSVFILDTVHRINSRITNEQDIRMALNCLDFQRHSARIDTTVRIDEFRTSITFRDISYLGNNMFMAYRTYIELSWDEHGNTTGGVIAFSSAEVASRTNWNTGAWIDYSKGRID